MNIDKEEYLKLLSELDEPAEDISDDSWFYADPPAKEKMLKARAFSGSMDCTNFKREQILKAIKSNCNLQVGPFSIRIRGFYHSEKADKAYMSIDLFEKKTKTPTGHPCNMDYKVDVMKDNRFEGRPWAELFNNHRQGTAINVPIETVVEIVKWLQALKKLTAFL